MQHLKGGGRFQKYVTSMTLSFEILEYTYCSCSLTAYWWIRLNLTVVYRTLTDGNAALPDNDRQSVIGKIKEKFEIFCLSNIKKIYL